MSSGWKRLRKCPVCGHAGYCTVSADQSTIKCMRAQNDRPVQQRDGATGWLHSADGKGKAMSLKPTRDVKPLTYAEVRALLKSHRTAINPERLKKAAAALGLSIRSLSAYGIGWDTNTAMWSFPMFDGTQDGKKRLQPCGIRLRGDNGKKLAVPGSRNGLFVPVDLLDFQAIPDAVADQPEPLIVLTPEGPTDSAAAFDLGFRAIGRPSNSGGAEQLAKLFAGMKPHEVVVVADRDATKFMTDGTPYWPGIEGALSVIRHLKSVVKELRFFMPPVDVKDLREWLPKCSPIDLMIAVGSAPLVTERWLRAAEARIKEKRAAERKAA